MGDCSFHLARQPVSAASGDSQLRERSSSKKRKLTEITNQAPSGRGVDTAGLAALSLEPGAGRRPPLPVFSTPTKSAPSQRSESADRAFGAFSLITTRLQERGDDVYAKDCRLFCSTCQLEINHKKQACDAHFKSVKHAQALRKNQAVLGAQLGPAQLQAKFNEDLLNLLTVVNLPISIVSF